MDGSRIMEAMYRRRAPVVCVSGVGAGCGTSGRTAVRTPGVCREACRDCDPGRGSVPQSCGSCAGDWWDEEERCDVWGVLPLWRSVSRTVRNCAGSLKIRELAY